MHRLTPSGGSGGESTPHCLQFLEAACIPLTACGALPPVILITLTTWLSCIPLWQGPSGLHWVPQSKISFHPKVLHFGAVPVSVAAGRTFDLWCSTQDLVLWPDQTWAPSLGVQRPSHWTTREVAQDPSVNHICKVSFAKVTFTGSREQNVGILREVIPQPSRRGH